MVLNKCVSSILLRNSLKPNHIWDLSAGPRLGQHVGFL